MFENIGDYLATKGFILRSGHAPNADQSFEKGCDRVPGSKKEIYLPWKGFEGSTSSLFNTNPEANKIVTQFHPNWGNCSEGAKKLLTRNVPQILGKNLDQPSDFLICWTPNGAKVGGTAIGLSIAEYNHIPIFNAGAFSDLKYFRKELFEFINTL